MKVLCDVKKILCLLHPPPQMQGRLRKDAERLRDRKKWFDMAREAIALALMVRFRLARRSDGMIRIFKKLVGVLQIFFAS